MQKTEKLKDYFIVFAVWRLCWSN